MIIQAGAAWGWHVHAKAISVEKGRPAPFLLLLLLLLHAAWVLQLPHWPDARTAGGMTAGDHSKAALLVAVNSFQSTSKH
jgi:hypothetical protein